VSLLWAPLHSSFPPFRAYTPQGDLLFGAFEQWDSGWFLRIADHGYDLKQSAAFFPLYPLLVHGLAVVTRSSLVAAMLISLAAGGAGVVVLHRLARPLLGERGADDTVLLYALYPLAFVFTAAYSEGLFLVLAAGSFLAAVQRRSVVAGILGALAVATRLIGLALLPALLVLLWPRRRSELPRLAPLLLLPAAVAAHAWYLHTRHLGVHAFLDAESVYWLHHHHALGPLSGLWIASKSGYNGAAELGRHLPRGQGAPTGFPLHDQWAIWNVTQFVLLVAALWLTWIAWRRLGPAFGLYSVVTLVIVLESPADVVPLVSLPRYLIGDFPLFLALAAVCSGRPRLRATVLYGFAMIGAAAAVGFAHHVWIA
jgi:Mannosyltransferase (PIG-V)